MPINVTNTTKGEPKYEYNVNKLETENIICNRFLAPLIKNKFR